MLDQVLAIKWVKENIQYFHGDPDRVTVFGESTGSASIAFHLLSPRSKGLFQSGTALGYAWGGYITADNAMQYSQPFATNLGCDEGGLACLQSRDKNDIIIHGVTQTCYFISLAFFSTQQGPA